MWNPTTCNCKCVKKCEIGDYLDFKSCAFKEIVIIRVNSALISADEI